MRILVTGSRDYTEEDRPFLYKKLNDVVDAFEEAIPGEWSPTLVVGDCPTGVDLFAFQFWAINRWPIEMHKADWTAQGKKAGPLRNQEMVDSGVHICLAFPKGESRGTRGCAKLAKDAQVPTMIMEYPNGNS